jgi:uncharacterized protein with HEPN domain
MKENDRIRIQHIIDAAQEALSFVRNTDQENFSNNRMMILSVIKEIEIIGEAVSKISDETKSKYYDIPWKDIVGMRNRLIHGYFEADVKLVWNTTKINLPPLVSSLEAILAKDK